jgi:hypothetical protein
MPAEAAQSVVMAPLGDGYQPPPPSQCVVNSGRPLEGMPARLLLAVPPFYPDEVRARVWAGQHGYTMAPPIACPVVVAQQYVGSGSGNGANGEGSAGAGGGAAAALAPAGSSYHISSPGAGQQVSGVVAVVGTAAFDPAQVAYYKLEIGSGRNPNQWTTFGSTHSQPVVNGVLEELHAYALPAGEYVIRLVLVGNDGNYPAPYVVPITIGQ